MIGVEKLFHWSERQNLGPERQSGEAISANSLTGEVTGTHLTGALGEGFIYSEYV